MNVRDLMLIHHTWWRLFQNRVVRIKLDIYTGADPGRGGGWGGAHPARPHKIGKNKIFWRKYPNNFRASLRSVDTDAVDY
jgi:hypothetical protein